MKILWVNIYLKILTIKNTGFTNVQSSTLVCGSSSCNKSVGKAQDVVLAVAAGAVVDEETEGGEDEEEMTGGGALLNNGVFAMITILVIRLF